MSKRKSNEPEEKDAKIAKLVLSDTQNLSHISRALNNISKSNEKDSVTLSQPLANAPCLGIIENVTMKNFKCHAYFSLDMHPFINFIIGRNGSGKSAVMDAIILCLGGRANSTGRQAAIKSFIKRNTEKAELSVTLNNIGDCPYFPEKYGKKIIIERKFNINGASNYRVLNEKKTEVSNKKQEVDNIVEQFNIQVSNPICFLNQETSKNFLNSSKETDKYQLFLKASQIESMQKIQEKTQLVRQNSLDLIAQKNVELKYFEKEFLDYELKFKATESIEKMRKKLSVLMVEYIWAVIISDEKILKKKNQEKDQLIKLKLNYESKINENKIELNKSNNEYKRLENYLNQFKLNYEETINQFNESVNSLRSLRDKYKSTDKKVNKLNNSKEKRLKNIEDIEKKLDEQRNLCENDYIVEKKQKEETISKISEQLNEKLKIESIQIKKIESFTKSIELSQKEADNKKADLKSSERTIESLKNDINDLNKSTNDQIYRYGHQMANLVKEVDVFFNNGSFRHKPRGPIGMYIKPRDDEYSLAIEQCIGGLLTSFICANHQDEKILQELARKHYGNRRPPSIIVTDFNDPRYDPQRFKQQVAAHTNYPTVYDMLDIQDNIVANTLMDQRMIESIYLLPNYEIARKLVEFGTGREKIHEAYIPNGDQYINKLSYKTYACNYNSSKYFIKDTSNLINSKHQKINDLANNMPVLTQAISSLNKQIVENKRSKDNEDKHMHLIRKEINTLKNQLDDAKNIYIQEPVNLSVYEEELNKIKNEINKIDEEIKKIEADSSSKNQDFQKAKQNAIEWESKKQKMESEHQECILKVTQIESDIEKSQEELNYYKELKDDNQIKIDKLMPTISEYEKEIEKLTQQAYPHVRIETDKNHEKLDIEIQLLEKEIKKNDKINKNQKEIGDIYQEKKLKFNQIKNEIKMQKKFLEKLAESVRKREERIDMFIKSKSHRCVMSFTEYITSRGYSGYLQFDHIEQKLKINVSPSDNISNFDKNKDTKSLSGGERSFSTVSFLLSLWSIVESPILFLDEFDVFMDQLNRKFAMELIIDSAKKALNGQYVFLTPQETGQIDMTDRYIKVYKMPDPKRSTGQQDHNEQNAENMETN